jgi:hypothetical protein
MKIIFQNILSVLLGFVSASVVMTAFEYANHLMYPFPEGFDPMNQEQVKAFAETIPSSAYFLVFLGWVVGAVVGGYVCARFSKGNKIISASFLALLLFIAGWSNYFLIGDSIYFYLIATPILLVATYLGYKLQNK